MFVYEKRLEYPIKIANTDPRLAAIIISQYGGPYHNSLQFHHKWKRAANLTAARFPYFRVISHSRRMCRSARSAAAIEEFRFPCVKLVHERKRGLCCKRLPFFVMEIFNCNQASVFSFRIAARPDFCVLLQCRPPRLHFGPFTKSEAPHRSPEALPAGYPFHRQTLAVLSAVP